MVFFETQRRTISSGYPTSLGCILRYLPDGIIVCLLKDSHDFLDTCKFTCRNHARPKLLPQRDSRVRVGQRRVVATELEVGQ
jgi:hypothetical protein